MIINQTILSSKDPTDQVFFMMNGQPPMMQDTSLYFRVLNELLSGWFNLGATHLFESVKASGDEKITEIPHNFFMGSHSLQICGIYANMAETDRVVTDPNPFLTTMDKAGFRIESTDFKKWSIPQFAYCIGSNSLMQCLFFSCWNLFGSLAMHDQVTDRVWTELAWSKDTIVWERIEEGLLSSNALTKLDYDYGCVYACANPVFFDDHSDLLWR